MPLCGWTGKNHEDIVRFLILCIPYDDKTKCALRIDMAPHFDVFLVVVDSKEWSSKNGQSNVWREERRGQGLFNSTVWVTFRTALRAWYFASCFELCLTFRFHVKLDNKSNSNIIESSKALLGKRHFSTRESAPYRTKSMLGRLSSDSDDLHY